VATFKGPKRPENHQIGDDAKTQVMALFSSQGWVVDPTITYYGEDLDVRLTTKNELIPVRFFVQLKGTKDISKFEKTDHYSVPDLKQTTVLYWLNSEAPTILLLWDIKTKQGVYGIAKEIFPDNLDANQKTVTAEILKENHIDEHKIDSFRIDIISNYSTYPKTLQYIMIDAKYTNPR
jgi:hypothetical protein